MWTGLTMQSSEAPVSEASAMYCHALMTAGSTAGASSGTKPLAVTCSQRHDLEYPKSHLVTSRAYTASKLTSNYVSEICGERPSELVLGIPNPHVKSKPENHIRHGVTLQREDIPNIGNTLDKTEYLEFIHPSLGNRSHSASSSEAVTTETESSREATKNDDVLYCEIKDDDHRNQMVVLPRRCSTSAVEDIVIERDRLLQHVSRLTVEKQEVVYKLRDFVETNAQLHADLERAYAAIAELRNKLHEVESTLEQERHGKTLMNVQTSASTEHRVNQPQLEGAVVKTGDVDGMGLLSSSVVQAELRQAVQLATEQQRQLETLRDIVKQQNRHISRLCRRDVSLGLELRQASTTATSDVSRVISSQPAASENTSEVAASVVTTTSAAVAVQPIIQEEPTTAVVSQSNDSVVQPSAAVSSTAVHSNRPLTMSPHHAAVVTTHLPPPQPSDRQTRRSPPPPARPGIETPTCRPTSHTEPARPLIHRESETTQSDLESLPIGFEMTTACPICQTPIPFDASSSDAFSRHVDECISRVTKEGPSGSSRTPVSANRTCPMCNMTYPADKFSQRDFEMHVNNHFVDDDPVVQQFEPLMS